MSPSELTSQNSVVEILPIPTHANIFPKRSTAPPTLKYSAARSHKRSFSCRFCERSVASFFCNRREIPYLKYSGSIYASCTPLSLVVVVAVYFQRSPVRYNSALALPVRSASFSTSWPYTRSRNQIRRCRLGLLS